MLVVVFRAFLRAGIADLCANRADPGRVLASSRHQPDGQRANICAIAIQLDAASHHLYVLLVQALRCAMLARDSAGDAGMNTTLIFLVWHLLAFYC